MANPAAGLAYSPGNVSAEPGIPGPRRPAHTAPTAASDRGVTQPRRDLGCVGLVRGNLPGLGDQRLELGVVQAGRRRIVRVFVLVRVAWVLIIGVRIVVHPLRPVRTLRHRPPVRGSKPGMVTGSRGQRRTDPRPARGPGEPVFRS